MFKTRFQHYTILLLGSAILAFGLCNIHARSSITEGGVLGITLLLRHHFGISPSVSEVCIDLICYLLGWKLLGKAFVKNAAVATVGFALFYRLFEHCGPVIPDLSALPVVAALLGALFVGVGVGLVVREGGAAGGDDAIALIIHKLVGCRIGLAYLCTDVTVLLLALTYIPLQKILCSLLTVTLSSRIIDRIGERKKQG